MLHGVIPAVMVPFLNNGKDIDQESLRQHVDFMIEKGVHGFFVNGTMGEGMVLNNEERKLVTEIVVDQTAKRIPVVIQVTTTNQDETIELSKHAQDVGADGISIIAPSFYPFDSIALKDFFEAIAREVPEFPIYLYNNPGRSGNGISPKLVGELAEKWPNIVGIKDSSKDIMLFQEYIEKAKKDGFACIIGTDGMVLTSLYIGGTGVVSAIANPYPEPFVKLYEAFNNKDFEEAHRQNNIISQLRDVLKIGPYLAGYKYAIETRGYRFSGLRKPLRDFTSQEKATFEAALAKLDLNF
ncbi:MAG: dihydrodipicolinate synthase family protein [Bacillota bacterium]